MIRNLGLILLAAFAVLPLGWALGLSAVPSLGLAGLDAVRFLLWALLLAALPSWAATWAWSIASRRLPLSLAGQLIVFETLFALLYGALHEGHAPGPGEAVGAAFMLAGVVAALRAFAGDDRARALTPALAPPEEPCPPPGPAVR